jgi:hypothetical protein
VAEPDVPSTDPTVPAGVLGPLKPLLAAQAEALVAELQVLFVARLEEVFQLMWALPFGYSTLAYLLRPKKEFMKIISAHDGPIHWLL